MRKSQLERQSLPSRPDPIDVNLRAARQQGSVASSSEGRSGLLGTGEVLLLALLVLLVRVFALHCFPTYDDAFITYRYAANMAAGHGLVFNPGAPWEPVLGTTTPGYAVLLAGLAKIGLAPPAASLALNLTCDVVSALLLAQLLGRRRLATLVTLVAFACLPTLARISVGGMEAPLFLALTLGATAAAQSARLSLAGSLAAIACCVRPEAVLLVAVLAGLHVRSLRQALRFGLPVALIGALAAGVLTNVYGQPIPQSISAKADNHGLGPRFSRMGQVLQGSFAPLRLTVVLLPLVLLGYARGLVREPRVRAVLLFALAMIGAYLAAGAKTWGWYFYVPQSAWCLTLGLGTEAALATMGGLAAKLDRPRTVLVSVLVLTVVSFVGSRQLPDLVTRNVYRPLEAWIKEVRLSEQRARIEASDIGAIAFYSGARVLDSEGLVWPQALEYGGQMNLIEAERPEYVFMVAARETVQRFRDSFVFAEYTAVARFNVQQDGELEPDVADLPIGWAQDYIIFARRDHLEQRD